MTTQEMQQNEILELLAAKDTQRHTLFFALFKHMTTYPEESIAFLDTLSHNDILKTFDAIASVDGIIRTLAMFLIQAHNRVCPKNQHNTHMN